MTPRRFVMEYGDQIALAVILPVCIMAIVGGIGEIRHPKAPPAGLEEAYRRIRNHIESDRADYAGVYRVPGAHEAVAASYDPATNDLAMVRLPGRIFYPRPPRRKKPPRPGDPDVEPVLALWGGPFQLATKSGLGRVELGWGTDPTDKYVTPLRWEVERRAAGKGAWKRIAAIQIAPDEKAFSYVDADVAAKTKYEYRVRGMAMGCPPADTEKVHYVLIGPDGITATAEEEIVTDKGSVKRTLWTGSYTDAASATTPRDIKVYLAGFIGGGAARKARTRVIRHNGAGGWANFEATTGVNETVVGRRDVRKRVADGSIRWVTEGLDTELRLVEIVDRMEEITVWYMRTRLDPKTGRTYEVREPHIKWVTIRKLKLVDVETGEVVWAPSVRDVALPGAASVASAPAPRIRTGAGTPRPRPKGGALINRVPVRKPPVAAPRRDDRPEPPDAMDGPAAGNRGMTEDDREAIDGPRPAWEGETR